MADNDIIDNNFTSDNNFGKMSPSEAGRMGAETQPKEAKKKGGQRSGSARKNTNDSS